MTESGIPTTLPSPVDRKAFQFVAIDAAGAAWRWVDDEMIWERTPYEKGGLDAEAGGDAPH